MVNVKVKKSLHSPTFSFKNKLFRLVWNLFSLLFFRMSPTPFVKYRVFLLRLFGAKISYSANIYPSVKVWLPSNLIMADGATLGPNVNVYNQGEITIGERAIVSQGVHLCASTHDYNDALHPLVLAPITIGNDVWICAEAFIGPNVTIEHGCVIGARSVLTKSTEEWTVYGGNPAKALKQRTKFND